MKRTLFFACSLGLLVACGPADPTQPADPAASSPGTSPISSPEPSPDMSASPGQPAEGPEARPVLPPASPEQVQNAHSLRVVNKDRFLEAAGAQLQLQVEVLDAAGEVIPNSFPLLFSSNRPGDVEVNTTGLVTALKDFGYAEIQVRLQDSDISASLQLSINNVRLSGSSGGGGGGGGGAAPPPPTPPQITQLSASTQNVIGFGVPVKLTAASDTAGATLSWSCAANCATFESTEGAEVFWNTPQAAGTYTLTLTVTDNGLSSSDTLQIVVSGGQANVMVNPFQWIVNNLAGSTATPAVSGHANANGLDARFNNPLGMVINTQGIVYIADSNNHVIRAMNGANVTDLAGSAGNAATTNGTLTAARFNRPSGLAFGPDGHLYVADASNHCIRKMDIAGNAVTTFAGACGTAGTTNHATDPLQARFNLPRDIAFDALGNAYIADANNHAIRKITHDGAVSTLAGGTQGTDNGQGTAAQFNTPVGLAIREDGLIMVTDSANHCIRGITQTGAVSTTAGACGTSGFVNGSVAASRFNNPYGVGFAPNGDLYIADNGNRRIRRIAGTTVSTFAGTGTAGSDVGPATQAATFNGPVRILFNHLGQMLVSDFSQHSIRIIQQNVNAEAVIED